MIEFRLKIGKSMRCFACGPNNRFPAVKMSYRDRVARLRSRCVLKVRYPRAARVFTQLTAQECLSLVKLASKAPPGVLVEIGSYLGASTAFLSEGSRRRNEPASLYCVDTWMNDAMTEGSRDTYAEFLRNTASYADVRVPVRGRSDIVGRDFNHPISLLFLDGDHSYRAVRLDLQVWLPKVVPGGIVILHDVGWAEGVQRVTDEFIRPIAVSEWRLPNMYWARVGENR